MAETSLEIAGRHYVVRCRDGEEAHLANLATLIEDKARAAQANAPGLTEVRTLLFAALFLADELNDTKRELAAQASLPLPEPLAEPQDDEPVAQAVEALALRIEKVATALAVRGASA